MVKNKIDLKEVEDKLIDVADDIIKDSYERFFYEDANVIDKHINYKEETDVYDVSSLHGKYIKEKLTDVVGEMYSRHSFVDNHENENLLTVDDVVKRMSRSKTVKNIKDVLNDASRAILDKKGLI